jgi:hypothetical protein
MNEQEQTEQMMIEIDIGHTLLDGANNDLSAAISLYVLNILAAVEYHNDADNSFHLGMREGFARVAMGLTGLLSAYEDRVA